MSVKENLQREADSASKKLHEASDEVKREARGLRAEAEDTAASYAEEGKQVAAGHLHAFADAVRAASDELAERDQGVAPRLVTEAADGLQKVANSVSGATVEDMVSSVSTFARRNPAAFVVGSVLAGIALGRFVKASGERSHEDEAYPVASGGAYAPRRGPAYPGAGASSPSRPGPYVGPASAPHRS